jgi:hypothetical protein
MSCAAIQLEARKSVSCRELHRISGQEMVNCNFKDTIAREIEDTSVEVNYYSVLV